MTQENKYLIPVNFITSKVLMTYATSESEAVEKVKTIIKNNQHANEIYDKYEIQEKEIISDNEDKIIDKIIEDTNWDKTNLIPMHDE